MPKSKKSEWEEKITNSRWIIRKDKGQTFINAGTICVCQIVDCMAEAIVEHHNKMLTHEINYSEK